MAGRTLTWALLFLAMTTLLLGFMTAPVSAEEDVEVFDDEGEDDVEVFDEEADEDDEDDGDEEDDDDEEEEEDYFDDGNLQVMSHPDIESAYIFPDHPDNKIVLGEKATVVVVLSNAGDETFNLQDIRAHLHSPFDFTYYIQNYTGRNPEGILAPNSEVSLEYSFTPDKALEALEFWLSAYVTYNDTNDRIFRTTFTNTTVTLVEGNNAFTFKTFFTYGLVAAALGLVAYVGLTMSSAGASIVKATSTITKQTERGTASSSSGTDGWGDVYTQGKGRAVGRKKSRKQR